MPSRHHLVFHWSIHFPSVLNNPKNTSSVLKFPVYPLLFHEENREPPPALQTHKPSTKFAIHIVFPSVPVSELRDSLSKGSAFTCARGPILSIYCRTCPSAPCWITPTNVCIIISLKTKFLTPLPPLAPASPPPSPADRKII